MWRTLGRVGKCCQRGGKLKNHTHMMVVMMMMMTIVPGVVENGLFTGLCTRMIMAEGEKIVVKERGIK